MTDSSARQRGLQQRVLIAITLGYGLAYPCRLAIGVVKKPLIDHGIFTPAELGTIGSALFFAYAFGKLFNGFIADHVNVRVFMALGFVLSALCCVGMGLRMGVLVATLLWGFNGWFQSFGAPSCVVALSATFPEDRRGRAYGIWSTSHSIGEGLTFLAVATMVGLGGWQWGFWSAAGMGLVSAALALALLRGVGHGGPVETRPNRLAVLKSQLSVLAIPSIWILGLASALAYVTRYAMNSWGILYLQEARGLGLGAAGTLLLVSNLVGIAGAVAFGFVSDMGFKGRRPPANLIFGLIEIAGLLLIFFGPATLPVLVAGMVFFGLGMTGLVTSLGGLFAVDIAPKRVSGAALGVIGIFSYLGSGIQEQISGQLVDAGRAVSGGVVHYDFSSAILFWLGASVASMLLAACLWRRASASASASAAAA